MKTLFASSFLTVPSVQASSLIVKSASVFPLTKPVSPALLFRLAADSLTLPCLPVPASAVVTPPAPKEEEKGKSSAQVESLVLPHAVLPNSGGLKPEENSLNTTQDHPKKRASPLTLRVSEAQKELLQQKAKANGVPVGRYVLSAALGHDYKPPLPPDFLRVLLALLRELTAQGNNLNQIAKHLNGNKITEAQGNSLLDVLGRSLLRTLHSIRKTLSRDDHGGKSGGASLDY